MASCDTQMPYPLDEEFDLYGDFWNIDWQDMITRREWDEMFGADAWNFIKGQGKGMGNRNHRRLPDMELDNVNVDATPPRATPTHRRRYSVERDYSKDNFESPANNISSRYNQPRGEKILSE